MNEQNQTPNPTMDQQSGNTTSINLDDKTMGIIAHVGGLLTGFIVPLIIWLIQKDKPTSALEHAKEALNFQITVVIGYIAAGFLSVLLIGFLLYPVLFIASLIFSIQGAMAASNNQPYKYPFSWRIIK